MQLDPHHGTPTYHQAVHEIDSACNRVFERQKERALAKNRSLSKARVWKSEDDSSDYSSKEYAEEIYEFIEVEFREMPALVRPALEDAMLSGLLNGLLQLEIHDTKLIAEVNTVARDYAADRAAELVGMKYNHDGELVANPRAEWAISDTTRDKIKRVVTEAFEGETKIADVAAKIEKALEEDGAGIFTPARARMIAETETAFAQVGGNWTIWSKSGLVKALTWGVSSLGPCDICAENDGVEVEFGKPFPSGDLHPPVHPHCRCTCYATKVDV